MVICITDGNKLSSQGGVEDEVFKSYSNCLSRFSCSYLYVLNKFNRLGVCCREFQVKAHSVTNLFSLPHLSFLHNVNFVCEKQNIMLNLGG